MKTQENNLSDRDKIDLIFKEKNCYACHSRNGIGGPEDNIKAFRVPSIKDTIKFSEVESWGSWQDVLTLLVLDKATLSYDLKSEEEFCKSRSIEICEKRSKTFEGVDAPPSSSTRWVLPIKKKPYANFE